MKAELIILFASDTIIFLFLYLIKKTIKQMALTQEELAQGLTDVTTQLVKVKGEVTTTVAKVAELEAALANQGTVSPEVQAAFEGLKASVTAVDELIPDTIAPDAGV